MESKKDIGKLFRDQLEQLDFSPSTKVWEQIERDLKKKRRFIIWCFYGTLLLGSLLGGIIYTLSDGKLILEKKTVKNSVLNKIESPNSISKSPKNNYNNALSEGISDNTTVEKNSIKNQIKTDTFLKSNYTNSKNKLERKTNIKTQYYVSNTIVRTKKKLIAKRSANSQANYFLNKLQKEPKTNSKSSKINAIESLSDSKNNPNTAETSSIEMIVKQTIIKSLIAESDEATKTSKKNIKEKDLAPIKDSVINTKAKTKDYEIIVAPYYGINYGNYFRHFDVLSNNTVLDNKSVANNTYGILLRWIFDNKFGIQTGLGKINSSYVSTIEKTGETFINTQNVTTAIPINDLNKLFSNESKVKLTYENSFVEVPLEAYYVVRNKKFGIATSFGISMLFGNKNAVFAESKNIQKIKIGNTTTNLPISVTMNGKLNLFYKITPSLQFDLYPTLQYQIMGSTDSSNSSSYFISFRTGLSYKF
jgi:hypothetical protein